MYIGTTIPRLSRIHIIFESQRPRWTVRCLWLSTGLFSSTHSWQAEWPSDWCHANATQSGTWFMARWGQDEDSGVKGDPSLSYKAVRNTRERVEAGGKNWKVEVQEQYDVMFRYTQVYPVFDVWNIESCLICLKWTCFWGLETSCSISQGPLGHPGPHHGWRCSIDYLHVP